MRVIDLAGRAVGIAAGATVGVLWTAGVWLPESGITLTGINFVVALFMALLALFAAIASFYGHWPVLVVLFVASFFPVGFAMAGADHWLSWAGRMNLCYLVAAALIWFGRRPPAAAGPGHIEQRGER